MAYKTIISEKITEYIKMHKEKSFCASDVYSYILGQDIKVNLVTIYRNLDRMTERNILVKYKAANSDSHLYRVVGECGHCQDHLHMQCARCGKIYHLEGDFMNEITSYIEKKYKFELDCGNSFLSGVCASCRENIE